MIIEDSLSALSHSRPIFHSEDDFKFAFAWQLQKDNASARIRLEVPVGSKEVDMLVREGANTYFVELKYKKRALECEHGGEKFSLSEQSARDNGRYDFLRDVSRLEQLTAENPNSAGYAILLTNDDGYWNVPRVSSRSSPPNDFSMRIHEGRQCEGTLGYSLLAAPGTTKGRGTGLELKGSYRMAWKNYSSDLAPSRGTFRYLMQKVVNPGTHV